MSNPVKNKVIAFFVEGDTEIEFYKALIKHFHSKNGSPFDCFFEYINLKGVGNYKKDALRNLERIKKKYPAKDIHAFLCYDTDVFMFAKKPPVDMDNVQKLLLDNGAKQVSLFKAQTSIEDWFLFDFEGIIRFLRLANNTKKENGNGQEFLKKLFQKANRIYVKGSSISGFIDTLDICKIKDGICPVIKPMCSCIGLDCKKICPNKN